MIKERKDIIEFSKDCMTLMGIKPIHNWQGDDYYNIESQHLHYTLANMHFHDRIDWAYILVNYINEQGKANEWESLLEAYDNDLCDFLDATPYNISDKCLDILAERFRK